MIHGQQQVRQLGRGDHEGATASEDAIFGNFGDADQATPAISNSTAQAFYGLGEP